LQQDETFEEAMIAQKTQETSHTDPATGSSEDSLKTQLKEAVTQEKQMESVYTPDHPDVVAIKRRVASLRAEIAHNKAEPATKSETSPSDSPQLQQLKAQLRSTKQSLASAKQEQERLQKQVHTYEARIESSPLIEEEYKQVTRDHDTALQFYNTLQNKMNESSMATALEHRQQGEQFRVMDAPNLPDSPSYPNRKAFAGGGLAAGLALGLILAALLEYRDTTLRSEGDIWAFTKLPTLATVSYIDSLNPDGARFKLKNLLPRRRKAAESTQA
jgi:uncharacterized protein involved in exopolysaccharide biosynthesis